MIEKIRKRSGIILIIVILVIMYIYWGPPIPDDAISRAVRAKIDDDILRYMGKDTNDYEGVTIYRYWALDGGSKELVVNLVDAVNEGLKADKEKGKEELVIIRVEVEISHGAWDSVFSLANFSYPYNVDKKHEKYDEFQALVLSGTDVYGEEGFNELSLYTQIKDVKQVIVYKEMRENVLQENINWSAAWPGAMVIVD